MTSAEYQATLAAIGLVARMTLNLDFDGFIQAIDRAESIGPFVDPTLYQRFLHDDRARAELRLARDAATKLREIQKDARKLADLHGFTWDDEAAEQTKGSEA